MIQLGFRLLLLTILFSKEPAFIEMSQHFQSIHPIQEGSDELLDLLSKGGTRCQFIGSLEPIIDKRFSVKTLMMTSDLLLYSTFRPLIVDKGSYRFL